MLASMVEDQRGGGGRGYGDMSPKISRLGGVACIIIHLQYFEVP